ncbi:MAG: hypothetical protein GEV28_13035 [Actinophytocola sp.]|uniref:hypothetical protein n=1 Tax=Actinophytocola sp. TaxID=1872138 RepID=UPI001322022C|nr:hypothetical protein [Actinophytocola sp.]MPZ81264.1 hypothetical protein [Actinophytocola sp.]
MAGIGYNQRDEPICASRQHDGDRLPPRVAAGRQLCIRCRNQVEENLVELPALYELCAHMLDMRHHIREQAGDHGARGTELTDTVVAIRSDILGVLASWCGLVTGERGVTGPDELSIRRLTSFLAIHLSWLTEHTAAPDFADELAELASTARDVLRHDIEPRGSMFEPASRRET